MVCYNTSKARQNSNTYFGHKKGPSPRLGAIRLELFSFMIWMSCDLLAQRVSQVVSLQGVYVVSAELNGDEYIFGDKYAWLLTATTRTHLFVNQSDP